ncbi:hypothetical protein VTL71DRAFT_1180 [Oculimacula yallundae]|uniref:Uncharacterized protein n=1 Tax=Oculimacula yallundae TaxID=86028 RepID=A0ABR4D297_9HELO
MPTQRPFFSNFLAAFRAHSAIQQTSKTTHSSTPQSTHQHSSQNTSPSQPRTISTASKPSGATTTALTSLHSPRTSNSPLGRSPGPSSPAAENASAARYIPPRGRRGSDSSSEGFRDVLGAEKWYIGGRTATGEERYFKLGVVKRHTSRDRLSLDRLSL